MTILVTCGLQREARIVEGAGIIPIIGGGDSARLEENLEHHTKLFPSAKLIVSCGIAGALDPALVAGDMVIDAPASLADALLERLPGARAGKIAGRDTITATAAAKSLLRTATGASAVDMESHIAARVAARHGAAFAAIRAISDTAHDTLPPAALVGMNPDGSMALGRVLASLARRPGQLPALIRTGRSAELAFAALRHIAGALATLARDQAARCTRL